MKSSFCWDAEVERLRFLRDLVARKQARATRLLKPVKAARLLGFGAALCTALFGHGGIGLAIAAVGSLLLLVHFGCMAAEIAIAKPIATAIACVHAAEARLIRLQDSAGGSGNQSAPAVHR